MTRCAWVKDADPLMVHYHDHEWGVPVHDDRKHFEFLVLEGAQAGLSWSTILHRRVRAIERRSAASIPTGSRATPTRRSSSWLPTPRSSATVRRLRPP